MSLKNFLRRFKFSFSLYNLFNPQKLSHIQREYKKRGIGKFYFSPVSSSDFKNFPAEKPWLDEKNSKEVLPANPIFKNLDFNKQQSLLSWSDNGYAILNNFFSNEEVDKTNEEIERLIKADKANWRYVNKVMFAMEQSEHIRKMANDPKLLSVLDLLLGKKVIPFQSINFITGSQQKTHSDSIHMTTFPLGYLIAVWIALEDIHENNGPLHYYPGSHKMEYLMNEHFDHGGNKFLLGEGSYKKYEEKIEEILKSSRYEKKIFKAKKGDLLIWHANLLHGGEKVTDPQSTRKSMVFHYFAQDVICYHEITQRPALIKNSLRRK
jgi:ectoine hydroxylase-related dioxygenase (phytanoyl-CoA dioxygenase family)